MSSATVEQMWTPAPPAEPPQSGAERPVEPQGRPIDALREQVRSVRAEVSALLGLDPGVIDGVDGPALHSELRAAVDQLSLFAARVLARVEADGRWEAGGERTFGDWMARRHHTSTASVRREVALGRALDESLPGAAAAVAAGTVSLEHAQVLARVAPSSPARLAALAGDGPDSNEGYLLARAASLPVDRFRAEVQRWAARVDADAADREHERAAAREYVTLARREDGVALQGFLTHEHGDALEAVLRAVTGVPAASDERSKEERQAAALVDTARLVLDKGLSGGGQSVRPHISVHVSWEAMQKLARDASTADCGAVGDAGAVGAAELAAGRPIAPSVFARLACDSEISRVVFGPDGDVLDVGRVHRTYTGQQRRAVIARDRSCRYPGCGAPVMLGEVHHVSSWAHGGVTSVENGVLLCWHHHDWVHRRRIRVVRSGGGWEFSTADGRRVGARPGEPAGAEPTRDLPGSAGSGGGVPPEVGERAARGADGGSACGLRDEGGRGGVVETANGGRGTSEQDGDGKGPWEGAQWSQPPLPAAWGGPTRGRTGAA